MSDPTDDWRDPEYLEDQERHDEQDRLAEMGAYDALVELHDGTELECAFCAMVRDAARRRADGGHDGTHPDCRLCAIEREAIRRQHPGGGER